MAASITYTCSQTFAFFLSLRSRKIGESDPQNIPVHVLLSRISDSRFLLCRFTSVYVDLRFIYLHSKLIPQTSKRRISSNPADGNHRHDRHDRHLHQGRRVSTLHGRSQLLPWDGIPKPLKNPWGPWVQRQTSWN